MSINLELYAQKYFSNNEVVKYKLDKGGENFNFPILLKDKIFYDNSIQVLQIKKNEINDINIISMSYLQFLSSYVFDTQTEQGSVMIDKFLWLCEHCFKNDRVTIKEQDKKFYLIFLDEENKIEKIVNNKEFDDITKIILNQNDANYDNRYINPDVREMMEEYYKVKYKDVEMPSLEKRKAFVCSKTGKTFKEIGEYTCREFDLIYNEMLNSEIYIGEKIIQGSYKYQVDEEIKHPMFRPKTDPYQEIFEDTSVLSKKGMSGGQKLE